MIFWKIYFYFMSIMYGLSLGTRIVAPTFLGWFDMLPSTLAMIAFFGFAFNRKFVSRIFWQATFIICIVIEIFLFVSIKRIAFLDGSTPPSFYRLGWSLISLPVYIPVFLYAFRKNSLWEVASKKVV
jgi:hypothetical protein